MDNYINKNAIKYSLYITIGTFLFFVLLEPIEFKLYHIAVIIGYFLMILVFFTIFGKSINEIKEAELNKKLKKIQKNFKNTNFEEWTKKKTQEIAQLKENEQFRKEFIGNVAHELKTPIFNIQGFTGTLLDGAINDPNVNIKYLERTDKNAQRLIAIVKDLDTISKLETGAIVPEMSTFNLNETIEEILDILDVKASEYGVKTYFKAPNNDIYVIADKEKITEVIHNLVLNSIIYGRKNGETQIIVKEKKKKVLISVKDNGIGISQEDLKHIFERFFRVDKSRSRERGGSGLGLAIVKHIIDSHNQSIEVASEEGKGTTFIFSLEKSSK